MKKRTVAVLMSCVLAIGMFTGCGNKGTNDTKQTTAEEDQKAADEGRLSATRLVSMFGNLLTLPTSIPRAILYTE